MKAKLVKCPNCGEGMDIIRIDNKEFICNCGSKIILR